MLDAADHEERIGEQQDGELAQPESGPARADPPVIIRKCVHGIEPSGRLRQEHHPVRTAVRREDDLGDRG